MGRKYGRRAALKGARGPWSGWIRGAGDLVLGISKSTWSMGSRRRLNAQWRPTTANPGPAITRLLHIGFQLISTNESMVRTTHDHEKMPIDSIVNGHMAFKQKNECHESEWIAFEMRITNYYRIIQKPILVCWFLGEIVDHLYSCWRSKLCSTRYSRKIDKICFAWNTALEIIIIISILFSTAGVYWF